MSEAVIEKKSDKAISEKDGDDKAIATDNMPSPSGGPEDPKDDDKDEPKVEKLDARDLRVNKDHME